MEAQLTVQETPDGPVETRDDGLAAAIVDLLAAEREQRESTDRLESLGASAGD